MRGESNDAPKTLAASAMMLNGARARTPVSMAMAATMGQDTRMKYTPRYPVMGSRFCAMKTRYATQKPAEVTTSRAVSQGRAVQVIVIYTT